MGQSKSIGSNAILIVEDEAIVRFELIDMVEEQGYRVFAVADADEAIAILNRHSDVRVILIDIEMPRNNGWVEAGALCPEALSSDPLVGRIGPQECPAGSDVRA